MAPRWEPMDWFSRIGSGQCKRVLQPRSTQTQSPLRLFPRRASAGGEFGGNAGHLRGAARVLASLARMKDNCYRFPSKGTSCHESRFSWRSLRACLKFVIPA